MKRWHYWALALLFLFLSVEISLGSTWQGVTDQTIIDQADVIAEVIATDVRSHRMTDQSGSSYREYTLVEMVATKDCHKGGCKEGDLLFVSELGGPGMTLPGVPQYQEGQPYLVFLSAPDDGGVRKTILQEYGAVPTEPPPPDGIGAPMMALPSDEEAPDTIHNRLRRKFGLREIGPKPLGFWEELGAAFSADALAPPQYMAQGVRWRFANPVEVVLPAQPPAGVTIGQAYAYMAEVVETWNANSTIRFVISTRRTQGKGPGWICEPGVVNISWDDPKNEISDPVNGSGALAVGGWCGGQQQEDNWTDVASGAVVFSNGWSNYWQMTEGSHFVEVLTHEIGHVLVFAHSAESGQGADAEQADATMSWIAHFDGRRATLKSYDQRAKFSLYAIAATPSPSPSASPSPAPTASASPSPTDSPAPTSTSTEASPVPSSEPPRPSTTVIGGGGKGCGKPKATPTPGG